MGPYGEWRYPKVFFPTRITFFATNCAYTIKTGYRPGHDNQLEIWIDLIMTTNPHSDYLFVRMGGEIYINLTISYLFLHTQRRKKKSKLKKKNWEKKKIGRDKWEKKKKKYNTPDSNLVPHGSTNGARSCLTSLSGREAVLSWWYGRTCSSGQIYSL